MTSRDLSQHADLPDWLRYAYLVCVPGNGERVDAASLRREFESGRAWRLRQPQIAERVKHMSPYECIRHFWSDSITASALCWARGAVGMNWDDAAPAVRIEPELATPRGCLF